MIRNSLASVIIVFIIGVFAMAFITDHGGVRASLHTLRDRWKSSNHGERRRCVYRILWLLWTVILLHVTIIGRSIDYDPLSQLLTGWKITKVWNGSGYTWNFDALYNILMFIPYTLLMFAGFPRVVRKSDGMISRGGVLWLSLKISFLSSLFIETTQLIFSCGTFQISDLVYNTISGVIGGVIYIVIININNNT